MAAKLVRLLGAVLLVLGVAGVPSPRAQAANTLTVTNCDANGEGSLAWAVATAASGDTIVFGLDCPKSSPISLSATITIDKSLTIDGSGHDIVISGGGRINHFNVTGRDAVTFDHLTLQDGFSWDLGGALFVYAGYVTVNNTIFSNNSAPEGGAIVNWATTIINNSTFSDNYTPDSWYGLGGAITNASHMEVNNSTFIRNSAAQGGGAIFTYTPMSIRNSVFDSNSAGSHGGGAVATTVSSVTIEASTFTGNSAERGGAVFVDKGPTTIDNSTFTGNSATSNGGAIYNGWVSKLTIRNSTIANNSAPSGGGTIYNDDQSASTSNTVTIGGSIIAASTGGHCAGAVSGKVFDDGYNLIGGTGNCGQTAVTTLADTDPKLDPAGLQDNGGPTQTIALQFDSPAIGKIPSALCPATDQRGSARPASGKDSCDIGAYESELVVLYTVQALYDQAKPAKAGSTIPIKVQIYDANGNNVSSPNLTVTATKVERISSEVSDAPLLASGNANPDNNFRLTGDAYTYNLSTKGYQTGTYALSFTVSGDLTTYTVQSQVR